MRAFPADGMADPVATLRVSAVTPYPAPTQGTLDVGKDEAMAGSAGIAARTDYVESFLAEDEPTVAARARAGELGSVPVTPAAGAALRFLAATISAKAVVEIGTGTGVSGLWLMAGMRADGVLTSVDTEAEHQRAARRAFTEAGVGATRTRLIHGSAAEVLPRLTDSAYDLVFADTNATEYADYLTEARRLLHPGGIVVFGGVLAADRIADTSARDDESVAARELLAAVRDSEWLVPVLLSAGTGLLAGYLTPRR